MALDIVNAAAVRAALQDTPKLRERDLAEKLGISEAQLLAAQVGKTVVRINPVPDVLVPRIPALGEVMALTRNESCVSEKVGTYSEYRGGAHAGMVFNEQIDLRMFPKHWCHAFAVTKETAQGVRRSLQVFDAAGDAVHKVHLRDGSDVDAFRAIRADLALEDQSDWIEVAARTPPEAPKSRPDKVDQLRSDWAGMTDTHQFLRLCSKLKMNRLGAYRIVGAPFVRLLDPSAVDVMLHGVRDAGIDFMLFVGNQGCIQIHSGPAVTLRAMGSWQNILDPGFDMHLRLDHIHEVYAVEKPTQRGPALSVEAFDAQGGLILQAFPMAREGRDTRPQWKQIVDGLQSQEGQA
ncbi:MAG: hemin-degrading factor [Pelagimonas sp.]|jgi:putative hemin transport protein|nr:hemin-degrading factor [Pelagimonas sp.]